jgi:hypothetical protein
MENITTGQDSFPMSPTTGQLRVNRIGLGIDESEMCLLRRLVVVAAFG